MGMQYSQKWYLGRTSQRFSSGKQSEVLKRKKQIEYMLAMHQEV
jgi:hypothetical protein